MTSLARAARLLLLGPLLWGAAHAQPAPVPTVPQVPTVPAAAVGASSTARVSTVTRVTVSDVRAAGVDGAAADPAVLAAVRRDLAAAALPWTITLDGRAFTAVTARSGPDVTLRTTVVLAAPGGGPPGRATRTRTLRADAPPAPAAPWEPAPGGPLPVGWPVDAAWTDGVTGPDAPLDAAALLDVLLRAVAGPATWAALRGSAPPAPVPVTTTAGTDPATGGATVERAYGPWTFTGGGRGTLPRVTFTLPAGAARGTGTASPRRDGLPGTLRSVTTLPVHVTLESAGVRVTLTVTVEQRTALSSP